MPDVIGSKAHSSGGASTESFGPWVGNSEPSGQSHPKAASQPQTPSASSEASVDEAITAMRSYRAGTGPLGSLACLSGAAGDAPMPVTVKLAPKTAVEDSVFITPTKAVAFALSALMALMVVGIFSVRRDMTEMSRLGDLAWQEHKIADHNYTRNLLIQHLARDRDGKLAHLRDYAEQIDEFQARPQAVVIFTPEGDQAKPETLALPALRRRIERDIENIEGWTPPPLLTDHHEMRYTTAEIQVSRLPLGATLLLVIVAVIIWSTLSMRNLPALHAPAMCFKPSRVPLCWLAPVANLYLPCAIMRDIWYGSEPTGLTDPEGLRLPVIGLWWLTFLGAIGMFGYGVFRMATAVGVFMIGETARWILYADITVLAMAASTFVMVAAASWNQSRRIALVETMEAQLGPRRAWHRK